MDRILYAGKSSVAYVGVALATMGVLSFGVGLSDGTVTWAAVIAALAGGVAGLLHGDH